MTGTTVRVGIDPVDGIYGNGNDALIGGTASSIGWHRHRWRTERRYALYCEVLSDAVPAGGTCIRPPGTSTSSATSVAPA